MHTRFQRRNHLEYLEWECGKGFEVLTAVKTFILFFWVVTQCRLIGGYQRFGETYCHHLQGWSGGAGNLRVHKVSAPPSRHSSHPFKLSTSHTHHVVLRRLFFIIVGVRTWNLTYCTSHMIRSRLSLFSCALMCSCPRINSCRCMSNLIGASDCTFQKIGYLYRVVHCETALLIPGDAPLTAATKPP
jgi:hypothetical protein